MLLCMIAASVAVVCAGVAAPDPSPDVDQAQAARDLIARFVADPTKMKNISAHILPEVETDVFHLNASGGLVDIRGSSGVAIASGFYHYLKYYCDCEVSWVSGLERTRTSQRALLTTNCSPAQGHGRQRYQQHLGR